MGLIACRGLCDELGDSELGLVLGNTVEPDGHPSARLQARLDEALTLRHLGYFQWIIVSGGVDPNGHDEAAVMRDYLVARGVPVEYVLVDSAGSNTYESARHTAQIMRERRWKGVCVVTQYFHVPRARLALRRFGVQDVSGAHARFFEGRDVYSTAREVVGYVEYAFRRYEPLPALPRRKPSVNRDGRPTNGSPLSYSTNTFPLRRRACRPPGRLTLAGPSAGSRRVRTRSISS